MYVVNTATKTLLTTADREEALAFAETLAETHRYVEVLRVVTLTPWQAESVKVFTR